MHCECNYRDTDNNVRSLCSPNGNKTIDKCFIIIYSITNDNCMVFYAHVTKFYKFTDLIISTFIY